MASSPKLGLVLGIFDNTDSTKKLFCPSMDVHILGTWEFPGGISDIFVGKLLPRFYLQEIAAD